ncbi:Cytochrome P450 4g15 [Eumeta japonica]|uniref:Cytochrome P450 4g15 n=1 Tax=Eumeta variegata TaxID=151549 RepID=A0A4C1X4B3_EUMVA|nr:Cytochrome P450 4g15 [Eumeta japonica]
MYEKVYSQKTSKLHRLAKPGLIRNKLTLCMIMIPLICALNSVVIALLCAYAILNWFTRRQRELSKNIPGFPTLPFVGNIHQLLGNTEEKFLRLKEWSELAITHNSMSKLWFGPNLVLVIVKPEDIKAVTNAYIEKPFFYDLGRPWLGNGLVTAPGSVWKKNIKKLATTFTGSIIDGFQDVFNHESMRLTEKLESEIGKEPFDALDKYLAIATLETICQTALGISDISNGIINSEYYKTFNRTLELLISRGFNVFLYPEFIYSLTAQYREFKRCLKILHHISETVIAKKKQMKSEEKIHVSHVIALKRATSSIATLSSARVSPPPRPARRSVFMFQTRTCRHLSEVLLKTYSKPEIEASTPEAKENPRTKTFLDILLELREADDKLTYEQIQAEVDTVIVGGQETTATTLHHILIQLGKFPNVQKRLSGENKSLKRPQQQGKYVKLMEKIQSMSGQHGNDLIVLMMKMRR